MSKHLFLDLEDTICTPAIEGWHLVQPIHVEPLKRFIEHHRFDHIHLFSFALHDTHQRMLFQKHAQSWLENSLGVQFSLIPTVDEDIIPLCAKAKNIHPQCVAFSDAVDFWSKDLSFLLFIQKHPLFDNTTHPHEVHFIDDAIVDQTFGFPQRNLQGAMHHIDTVVSRFA